jgi:hypothetical protein
MHVLMSCELLFGTELSDARVDPTLRRDGTDCLPLSWVMSRVDPTLRRDGTDCLPLS